MTSKPRFVIALALAALVGGALVWMVFGGSLETYASPAGLQEGKTYRLNAIVATGSPTDAAADALTPAGVKFTVQDKDDASKQVPVVYHGIVPEQFKDGREIVVTGRYENGTFVADRDKLVTKCPSKFQGKSSASAT
ncbi:MAG TPA: cytochrome c maturation protein CcmE [Miltoncostaeales bacterium]|jgi:cytochrome c-type biogenesis protein CcmE|nr:cytochrome c maturation protein CcmE [Miltoncostaeales bacterium]